MNILTPRGIARIKRLGSGRGIRWFVFLPSRQDKPMGEIYKFFTKAEAIAFAKQIKSKGGAV